MSSHDRNEIPSPETLSASGLARLYEEQHPAVLRVTQAVLKGRAEAQDAAQEVFLKALQEQSGVRSRGWLLRSATNGAIDLLRRDRIRRTEVLGEARGSSRDPALQAEQREWEQRLLRGLLDLGPELRDPLILHYWDGCSLTEVGERLGIPRSTAHKRCRQGIALLRQKLEVRKASLPIIGWFLRAPSAGGESGSLTSVFTSGGSLMAAKSVPWALGILLLICLPFVFDWGGDESSSDPLLDPRSGSATGTIDGELRSGPSAKGEGGVTPVRTRAFEEQSEEVAEKLDGWVVHGKLLLGKTLAPPGAQLRVRLYPGWSDGGWPADPSGCLEEAVVVVRKGGRFVWRPKEEPEQSVTVVVRGSHEGHVSRTISRFVLGERTPGDAMMLMLMPLDARIRGFVRNPEGEAVAGAVVRGGGQRTQSDATGAYAIAVTSHRSRFRVAVWAAGYGVSLTTVKSPGPGETAEADLVLGRHIQVRGKVVDEAGKAIAGARLHSWMCRPETVFSEADGSFTMAGFTVDRSASFVVTADGYVEDFWWSEAPKGDVEDAEIVLKRSARVRGRVVDENDRPLEGARVGIGQGFSMGGTRQGVSDHDGIFRIDGVKPGAQGVHVVRPGFVQYQGRIEVPKDGGEGELITVKLRRGRTLEGRLIDAAGSPIPDVVVIAKKRDQYLEASDRSDGEGRFTLPDVAGPKVQVEIYGRRVVRLRTTLELRPEVIDVTLERTGVVAGRVVDASGKPVPRFRVRFRDPTVETGEFPATGYSYDLALHGRWFSSPEGEFVIDSEEVRVGSMIGLEVWAEGYTPFLHPKVPIEVRPAPSALVFTLQPAAVLRGRVLDRESGKALAGARLRWRLASDPAPVSFDGEDARTVTTTRDGSYAFRDLPAEQVILDVLGDGYPASLRGTARGPRVGYGDHEGRLPLEGWQHHRARPGCGGPSLEGDPLRHPPPPRWGGEPRRWPRERPLRCEGPLPLRRSSQRNLAPDPTGAGRPSRDLHRGEGGGHHGFEAAGDPLRTRRRLGPPGSHPLHGEAPRRPRDLGATRGR